MVETYPYYRFTQWLDSEKACEEWFDWFVGLDVPVCVTQESTGYALWVLGEESVDDPMRGLSGKKGNLERMAGWIVRQSDNWGGIKLSVNGR